MTTRHEKVREESIPDHCNPMFTINTAAKPNVNCVNNQTFMTVEWIQIVTINHIESIVLKVNHMKEKVIDTGVQ
jgi:hypothetical protein